MALYHLAPLLLGDGSVIEPGNWGRIKNSFAGDGAQAAREVILEQRRREVCPHLPSRLACVFLFEDQGQAEIYQMNCCPANVLYEVEIVDQDAPRHTADFELAVAGFNGLEHYRQIAQAYWSDAPKDNPEVLVSSAVRLMRRLM